MTTTQTDAIMALADRYAFHIPGSQHSDEARAALLAALQEQAPDAPWLTKAHMLCTDHGIPQGHIEQRLELLRVMFAAPVQAREQDKADAERYRWLREGNDAKHGAAWYVAVNLYGCEWDAAIDAAMLAASPQEQI